MDISEAVRAMAIQAIDGSKPVGIDIAEVINEEEEPLKIRLGDKLEVNRGSIVLSRGLVLKKGDKVMCIRKSGGQKFFVLCEIEPEPEEEEE